MFPAKADYYQALRTEGLHVPLHLSQVPEFVDELLPVPVETLFVLLSKVEAQVTISNNN